MLLDDTAATPRGRPARQYTVRGPREKRQGLARNVTGPGGSVTRKPNSSSATFC